MNTESSPDWGTFLDGVAICRWVHDSDRIQLFLIARHDGTFRFCCQETVQGLFESGWAPGPAGYDCSGIYDSEQTARREMKVIFPWLNTTVEERSDC